MVRKFSIEGVSGDEDAELDDHPLALLDAEFVIVGGMIQRLIVGEIGVGRPLLQIAKAGSGSGIPQVAKAGSGSGDPSYRVCGSGGWVRTPQTVPDRIFCSLLRPVQHTRWR